MRSFFTLGEEGRRGGERREEREREGEGEREAQGSICHRKGKGRKGGREKGREEGPPAIGNNRQGPTAPPP